MEPPLGCSASQLRRWRLTANVLLSASCLVLAVDWLVSWGQGPDVQIEAGARALIIAVAYLGTRNLRDARLWLLVWGLIGVSFDVFWSAKGEIPLPARYAMMALKYGAVSAGLAALLRFSAEFGGSECDVRGIRRALARLAWPLGAVLAAAGFARGTTFLQGCTYHETLNGAPFHDFWPCLPWVWDGFLAYLSADIVVRCAIALAAVVGLWVSRRMRRRFTVLAVSCVIFAVGATLDFVARVFTDSPLGFWLAGARDADVDALTPGKIVNAATTIAFPIGLLVAAFRGEFDGATVIRKSTIATIVISILFAVWTGLMKLVEAGLHHGLDSLVIGATHDLPHPPEGAIEVTLGFLVALLYPSTEHVVSRFVDARLFPDRGKRVHVLRRCVEQLQAVTERQGLDELLTRTAIECGIVPFSLYRAGEDGRLQCLVPHDDAFDVRCDPADARLATLREGKIAKRGIDTLFTGAMLAAPIVLRGKLIGVLVCGAPMRYEPAEFEPAEEHELFSLAREAGAALYAMEELKV